MPDPTIYEALASCDEELSDLEEAADKWCENKKKEAEISSLQDELNDKHEAIHKRDDAVRNAGIINVVNAGGSTVVLIGVSAAVASALGGPTTLVAAAGALVVDYQSTTSTITNTLATIRAARAMDKPELNKMEREINNKQKALGNVDKDEEALLKAFNEYCECKQEIEERQEELDALDEMPKGDEDEDMPMGDVDIANSIKESKGNYYR